MFSKGLNLEDRSRGVGVYSQAVPKRLTRHSLALCNVMQCLCGGIFGV